ncbi:hypothetical protein PCASD_07994 [Puccinia coronata f. sp. avenae]|uniref:Uncharacterized protein n=1 Tax=Puccinia coronata f. sp. avenae TaxID=200324 RepID=A0A2N5UPA7_9BASI|nr:hypothetical protein PCASD_07994 [Puccinia coronata f. sp. avenae]
MQMTVVYILAILGTLSITIPVTQAVNCNNIVPACNGGSISGKTSCPCRGQTGPCDLWTCPGNNAKAMACGQLETGCAFLD